MYYKLNTFTKSVTALQFSRTKNKKLFCFSVFKLFKPSVTFIWSQSSVNAKREELIPPVCRRYRCSEIYLGTLHITCIQHYGQQWIYSNVSAMFLLVKETGNPQEQDATCGLTLQLQSTVLYMSSHQCTYLNVHELTPVHLPEWQWGQPRWPGYQNRAR